MTWWRRLTQRNRVERQLDAELRDHVDRLVADYVRAGASEDDARRRARLAFGGVEQVKEECRDVRGTRWLEDVVQDLRYGLRILRRSPAFTLRRGRVARARHRCQQRDLLAGRSRAAEVAAGARAGAAGAARRGLVDQSDLGTAARPAGASGPTARWPGPTCASTCRTVARPSWSKAMWTSGGFFDVLGVPAVLGRTYHAGRRSAQRRPGRPGRRHQLRLLAAPLRRRAPTSSGERSRSIASRSRSSASRHRRSWAQSRPLVRRRRAARHAGHRARTAKLARRPLDVGARDHGAPAAGAERRAGDRRAARDPAAGQGGDDPAGLAARRAGRDT